MTFLEAYLIGLGVVLGLMALLWVLSLVLRNSSIVDPSGEPALSLPAGSILL